MKKKIQEELEGHNHISIIKLFGTGFVNVMLISFSTYCISHGVILGIAITSFIISMLWSYNVKRFAFSNFSERLIYGLGSSIGGVVGFLISQIIPIR